MQEIDQVHSTSGLPDMPLLPMALPGMGGMAAPGTMIGVRPNGEHPELTLAHEIAHQLSAVIKPETAADLMAAIADTLTVRIIRDWERTRTSRATSEGLSRSSGRGKRPSRAPMPSTSLGAPATQRCWSRSTRS